VLRPWINGVIGASALQTLLILATGCMDGNEKDVISYLREETRMLARQLGGRSYRLTDDDRGSSEAGPTGWAVRRWDDVVRWFTPRHVAAMVSGTHWAGNRRRRGGNEPNVYALGA